MSNSLKPPMSEIISQFKAAEWMDARIHRPSRLREANGRLFWTQGAVQELFSCSLSELKEKGKETKISKVIASSERTGKLSIEEELERERTRSRSVGVEAFNVSPDGKVIFYRANGKWYFYDVEGQQSYPILESFKGTGFPTNFASRAFSSFSFTCSSNIYIGTVKLATNNTTENVDSKSLDVSITQVTTIGDESKDIDCGAADYIISEEFSRLTGHWTNDLYVLYTISYTSHLNHISIPRDNDTEVMAYPRVNDANPIVIIALYEIGSKTYRVLPKVAITKACRDSNGFDPEYFPRFGFLDDETFYVWAMDRAQEKSSVLSFKAKSLIQCEEREIMATWERTEAASIAASVIHNQNIPWAWVDVTDAIHLTAKRSVLGYYATETQPEKPYFHLHVTDETASSAPPTWRPLTQGNYGVTPSGVTVVGDYCFFLAGYHDYLSTSVCAVRLGGGESSTVPLTSAEQLVYSFTVLKDKDGAPFGVAFVSATKNSPSMLSVQLFDTDLKLTGEAITVPTGWGLPLEGNWAATSPVKYTAITPKLYRPLNRRGSVLPAQVYIPTNKARADPKTGKLPVYLYMYGGPHVQLVRAGDEYESSFVRYHQTILHQGYVVIVCDNQMCHANHLKELSICKRNMGRFEVADFTDALDGLAKEGDLKDVLDLSRVAINGASYGGYVSLLAMAQAPDRFKLSFAEAPVGDWRLYDTGYTERYMGLLPADEEGYKLGAVTNYVNGFPDEPLRLFISHGLTDENVHFTNTTRVVDALEAAGKPFYMDVYPGERHGLRQKPTSVPHRRGQVISTMNALL